MIQKCKNGFTCSSTSRFWVMLKGHTLCLGEPLTSLMSLVSSSALVKTTDLLCWIFSLELEELECVSGGTQSRSKWPLGLALILRIRFLGGLLIPKFRRLSSSIMIFGLKFSQSQIGVYQLKAQFRDHFNTALVRNQSIYLARKFFGKNTYP